MASFFQKFQEAVKVLARSPTLAKNGRQLQFEADINRLFLNTCYNRLGKNAGKADADKIIDMASKASLSEREKQVQENIHEQVGSFCKCMDEILLPDSKLADDTLNLLPSGRSTDPQHSGLRLAVGSSAPLPNNPYTKINREAERICNYSLPMASLFQKFQETVKVLERNPTFAKNGRHLQFEADIHRPLQRSSFYYSPFRNASSTPNPDTKINREAERICKIVSEMGNLRNLGSSLDDANFGDLSPSVVLQVLNKLNNSGTMALSFFRWAEKQRSFKHTLECYNALIESLGRIKQFTVVWMLVDEMKNNGFLSKETFALVSRRLARARRVNEALEAFERMEKRYGLRPDLQDYNRLFDTLSKSRHVEKAQELFDTWKNWKFVPDIKSYAVLLEGWGERCNFLRLNEVYLEMQGEGFEPDVVTYGILINAHCKAKRHDKAIALFHKMSGKNLKATPHIYCTLINGLGAGKRLDEAIEFFNLYKSDCVMEAPTYNAMVGAYCWSMRIHDAYAIVDEMRKCGIGPNPRTYDIILHHLIKADRTSEASSVFERMRDELGVEPNLSTYEIMVRMFCNRGQMYMTLKVWDQMRSRGVIPGMHIFLALINGLCDQKRLGEACEYLQEMLDMGIRPPEFVFKRLKQGLLVEGKLDIVIVLDGKIKKLRDSPLFG